MQWLFNYIKPQKHVFHIKFCICSLLRELCNSDQNDFIS